MRRALGFCLFLSGVSGLIYEVIWMRVLGLAFGSTIAAVSISLAVFLGGMAVGAEGLGRRAAAFGRPLRAYACMEFAIGAYGLVSPSLLSAAGRAFGSVAIAWSLSGVPASLVQLLLVGIVLAFPTILMGGTIPVVLAWNDPTPTRAGQRFSRVYVANTLGAATGAVLSGYGLLPAFGLHRTLWAAAGLNVVAGAIAFTLSSLRDSARTAPLPAQIPSRVRNRPPGTAVIVAVVIATLSGFSTLFHEVVWTRVFDLILGNSTQAFSAVLTAFLIGLVAGALAAGRYLRRERTSILLIVAGSLLATGVAVLETIWFTQNAPFWFVRLWSAYHWSPLRMSAARFGLAAVTLVLPTFAMGAVLPLAIELGRSTKDGLSASVGRLYAVNTAGCLVGAILAGFVVIPHIGIRDALIAGAWINFLGAAGVAVLAGPAGARGAGAAAVLSVAGLLTYFTPPADPKILSAGVYFNAAGIAAIGLGNYRAALSRETILFYREGPTGTVAVAQGKTDRTLTIDGRGEASTGSVAQVVLGQAPFAIRPGLADVLVIGFGTGTTTGMVLSHPVRRVDAVELEPAVIASSHFFDDLNGHPLADPRTHVRIEDARALLSATAPASYDAILSEPSYPWVSGAAKLFSLEFYRLARLRLRPNGIFAQWVQLYNLDLPGVRSLLRTFSTAFPGTLVFDVGGGATELLLVGSDTPQPVSWPALEAIYADAARKAALARVQLPDAGSLLAGLFMGPRELRDFTQDAELNTDDNGFLEFRSASTIYLNTTRTNQRALWGAAGDPWQYVTGVPDDAARQVALGQMARAAARLRDFARALRYAQYGVDLGPRSSAYEALGDVLFANHQPTEALNAWRRAALLDPDNLPLTERLVKAWRGAAAEDRPREYASWVARLPADSAGHP